MKIENAMLTFGGERLSDEKTPSVTLIDDKYRNPKPLLSHGTVDLLNGFNLDVLSDESGNCLVQLVPSERVLKLPSDEPDSPSPLRQVAIGALVAATGAALTYATQWVSGHDLGAWTPVVVVVLSVATNFVRKLSVGPELKDEIVLKLAGKPEPTNPDWVYDGYTKKIYPIDDELPKIKEKVRQQARHQEADFARHLAKRAINFLPPEWRGTLNELNEDLLALELLSAIDDYTTEGGE